MGVIVYEGPSAIDGGPIVVIAVGTIASKANSKTGATVQTYILRADMGPLSAVRSGADVSICGDCKHRGDGTGKGRSCYVTLVHGPRAVWDAYQRGVYRRVSAAVAGEMYAGEMIRLGTYGDPAAVPIEVWQALTASAAGWTGYTHQWTRVGADWKRLVMASVDTIQEMERAHADGWRTFRVGAAPIERTEINCPASEESGKRAQCMGTAGKARVSIQIKPHGPGARHAA